MDRLLNPKIVEPASTLRNGATGAVTVLTSSNFVTIARKVTFVTTNDTGADTIPNVRPGKYRLSAIEDNDNAPRAGNLDDYEEILKPLNVLPKDKLTIDLKRRPPMR